MRQDEFSPPDLQRMDSSPESPFADLHVHSSASDGVLPPAEVVSLAAKHGLSILSICDHDTVAGLPEGFAAASEMGVELIPGVELSTYVGKSEVHILGYCFDHQNTSLVATLERLCRDRMARVEKMIGLLRSLGITLDRSSIDDAAAFGSVGRLHVARALFEQGFVRDIKEAFAKYIGRGKPAYAERAHVPPAEACQLIKQAAGIPVLAHPSLLDSDELIPRLVQEGIMGIEAFYSKITPDVAEHYCRIAETYGLLITGGSDCHQSENQELLLGKVKLDYPYVQKLKESASALRDTRSQ
jgi:predicted metal-dependent phosphoesterase TrpH